jgi:hypothetical protein
LPEQLFRVIEQSLLIALLRPEITHVGNGQNDGSAGLG